ncbi:sigma-70 family RNA polymerase sigma factor [Nocardioides sp. C4-1]|uniref:RNA polymerase sigma factor n=1 Tax=Nocardioides sp. C4-1 TaxID=3151851 RepID=UPI003264AF28
MTSPARRERFEAIAADVVDPLRRFLVRRTDAATADDVLADVLLVCWRRVDDVPADPLPWAYGVARRCLANHERGQRRQRRVAGRVATLDPPAETVPAADDDAGAAVRDALATLPERDAELLRLWAWEQLTPAEIAVVLDITANAASIRLHRARAKLRAALETSATLRRKSGAGAGHEESTEGRTP